MRDLKRKISRAAAITLLGVPLAMVLGVIAVALDILSLAETSWAGAPLALLGGGSLVVTFALLIVYASCDILTSNL